MLSAIMGKKIGMTQMFDERGNVVPVTVVRVIPSVVIQKRYPAEIKEGYAALVLGYEDIEPRKVNKPEMGIFLKTGLKPKRYLREVRVTEEDLSKYEIGQEVTAWEIFKEGEKIDVIGTMKGRGFSGVMKRHNFKGFMVSHGVHETFRGPGSCGSATCPGRVRPGKKLAGQYGNCRKTIQNLRLHKIDSQEQVIYIKGGIPGCPNSLVIIRRALKTKVMKTKK